MAALKLAKRWTIFLHARCDRQNQNLKKTRGRIKIFIHFI